MTPSVCQPHHVGRSLLGVFYLQEGKCQKGPEKSITKKEVDLQFLDND